MSKNKKIKPVSKRDIDVRNPNISISSKNYKKGVEMAREKAKKEKRKLITREGVEDYS